jgi:type I restriction-modification system DNA methylase subunit
LRSEEYSRTQLAAITRAVNKIFPMPALILFKHGTTVTLAVIDRRLHKRDESKDVLEKVTLIKDIRCANPHRAHIEILFDLSLDQLRENFTIANWVDLHDAWRKTLDTSELNKKFFREVANWYFWGQSKVKFPKGAGRNEDERKAISVIRLLTRLIFVWFVKEKNLIPDELFDKRRVDELLKYDDPKDSTYYKAILQNLFFATLNTDMNRDKPKSREFRHDPNDRHVTDDYLVPNKYRYQKFFTSPQKFFELCSDIPFLNGGLFECLDRPLKQDEITSELKPLISREGNNYVLRVDGFSERDDNELGVPDELFFGAERVVDLSDVYADMKRKRERVRGLIHTFNSYKFTVDENTPIEEEIALDPELLGKVFENLLAAYNPETSVSARKQTGSFYTPREIVNYMVDESLIAYLETQLKDAPDLNARLRHLFAYNDQPHKFNESEVSRIITAIDKLKALDPACGSGAFPMGLLHKLVYVLRKLDPDNSRWKTLQATRANALVNTEERADELADIEDAFANDADYARKLYLIENCLYGVDIQPIAVQIAKLRAFISLIVDDKVDDAKSNRGIRPLPNLETKFVAANSLIGIEKPAQLVLRNSAIDAKEKELAEARKKHFTARTYKSKEKYRALDAKLRAETGELLRADGFARETTEKLAAWNPYDQNTAAEFFDPEWMFGDDVRDGFDIVIANPPYGADIDKALGALRPIYFDVIQNYAEIYKMFFKMGLKTLKPSGVEAFITPNTFLSQPRYKDLRTYLLKFEIMRIVNLGENVFEQSIVPVCLTFMKNKASMPSYWLADVREKSKFTGNLAESHFEVPLTRVFSFKDLNLYFVEGLAEDQVYFDQALEIKDAGIQYHRSGIGLKNKGGNDLYERIISDKPRKFKQSIPVWYVKLINKYVMADETDEFFNLDYRSVLRDNETVSFGRESFAVAPKIIWRQTASCLQATIDQEGRWFRNTIQCAYIKATYVDRLDIRYVLGVVNSRYIAFLYNKLVQESGRVFPQVKITHVKKLPLVLASSETQKQISSLVSKILAAKRKDSVADTSVWEREIDALVYQLYGLTEEEIKVVEDNASNM